MMNTNKLFGFNSNLYFLTGLFGCIAILLLAGIVTAYSVSPSQNGLEWKITDKQYKTTHWANNGENDSLASNLNNFATKASVAGQAQTASIVGAWRAYTNYSGYRCVTESVIQGNGQYSAITSCNNGVYFTHLTGNWRYLQNGVIRIQYNNTRMADGRRDIPDGETVYFSFINRNQIRLGSGIIAYRIG